MRRLLSPGVTWPLFIVLLLATSVGMCVRAVLAARSDGGAQAVPDYYAEALRYEQYLADTEASRALGWQVRLHVGEAEGGLRRLSFTLHDATGALLPEATGTVTIQRPSRAEAAATIPFHAAGGERYAAALPGMAQGLWDVTVDARHADRAFRTTQRVEVP